MATEIINKIIDRPAIEAEKAFLAAKVKEIEQIVANAKTAGVSIMGAGNQKEFNQAVAQTTAAQQQLAKATDDLTKVQQQNANAVKQVTTAISSQNKTLQENIEAKRRLQNTIDSLNKEQKEDLELLRSGTISRNEYTKRINESSARIEILKNRQIDLNKTIKQQINDAKPAENAYKALVRQYEQAAMKAKIYAVTLGQTNPKTIEATARAKELSNQLKAVDASVGQNQRNVGNYGSAFAKAGAAFNKFIGPLRTAANILPGIGMSGILLLAAKGITSLASSIFSFTRSIDDATRKQKIFTEVQGEAVKNYAQEVAKIDILVAAAKNENLSRGQRNEAIKQLQKEYPEYLKNISLEKINSEEAKVAIEGLRDAVIQKAIADAYAKKVADEIIKRQEIYTDLQKAAARELKNEIDFTTRLNEERAKGNTGAVNKMLEIGSLNDDAIRDSERLRVELEKQDKTIELVMNGYEEALVKSLMFTKTKAQATKKDNDNSRKEELELFKFRMQLLIDEQKARANIAASGSDAKGFIEARTKQALLEKQLAEGVASFELKQKGLSASGRKLIEEKLVEDLKQIDLKRKNDIINVQDEISNYIRQKGDQDTKELQGRADKEAARVRELEISNLEKTFEARVRQIEANGNAELQKNLELYQEGTINKDRYEANKLAIENKYKRESIQAEIDYYSQLITLANLSPELQAKADEALNKLRKKLRDSDLKDAEQKADKELKIEKKKNDALKQLGKEVAGLAFDLFSAAFEKQKNQIQEVIDQLDKQKEKDIEVANQTIANTQQRADAIAIIEARAAAKRQQLERQQREADQRKARFEKARQIAEIIGNTAVAVAKALPNFVLAAIVGAIGAAQIARVLATPIPKYKDGTEDHPGGLAILGDGGKREPFVTPTGEVGLSPSKSTVYDLPAGTKVFPSINDYAKTVHQSVPVFSATSRTDMMPVVAAVGYMGKRVEKAISKIPQPVLKTDGNWSRYIKGNHTSTNWINKNI